MIFNVPGHIEMIRNGLFRYKGIDKPDWSPKELKKYYTHRAQFLADMPGISNEVKGGLQPLIVKTQSRRLSRGIYQVGRDYAVQRKRGVKADTDISIVMDVIWQEKPTGYVIGYPIFQISKEDALAEGGYDPISFEQCFESLGVIREWPERWAFEFHVEEVQK
jgi:hypothetical protein